MQRVFGRFVRGTSTAAAQTLVRWNRVLGVFLCLQGIVVILISAAVRKPLYALFLTRDSLQTQLTHHMVTAPAVHQLGSINLVYLVAAWLVIAGIVQLLVATVWRVRYEAGLKKGVALFRWIEAGVGTALVMGIIALIMGMYDIATLVALVLLAGTMAAAGFAYEYTGTLGKRVRSVQRAIGWLAVLLGSMPWVIVTLYAANTLLFGSGPVVPAYWFWLSGVTVLLMGAWGVNIYLGQLRRGKWANYVYGERVSMSTGVVLKTVTAWLIFAALLRP